MQITLNYKWISAVLVVGVAVFFLISWTLVQAAGDTITVCVKNNGAMYLIGEGFKLADCKSNDRLLSWNIAGSQGLQGEPGAIGAQGSQGLTGLTGADGVPGPAGPQGLQGPTGTSTGSLINKSRVYQKLVGVAGGYVRNSGGYEINAFCDNANDIMLTGSYSIFSRFYGVSTADGDSFEHIFNPSGIDSWKLRFGVYIPSGYDITEEEWLVTTYGPAYVSVTITCLRAD